MGTLIIIHDGSYMRQVSPNLCLAIVMIVCTFTGLLCKCTMVEKSAAKLLRWNTWCYIGTTHPAHCHSRTGGSISCNNGRLWQLRHGSARWQALPPPLYNANACRCFKDIETTHCSSAICSEIPVHYIKRWQYKSWKDCPLKEWTILRLISLPRRLLYAHMPQTSFLMANFP